ncbi:helix-turn-helix transcriptional regulator [Paenibacillus wulumuqiensis]|uniref:helix-turn-helix transcriptional regulator n=1 Tax=Paenibacillus wulumuqiensis TaxID=1567107 RepID=UPI000AA75A1A
MRSEHHLRNEVKLLRELNGYSQEQLGNMLGVSRQTINAIERGKYNPSLPLALHMARVFRTTVEHIFFLEEEPL